MLAFFLEYIKWITVPPRLAHGDGLTSKQRSYKHAILKLKPQSKLNIWMHTYIHTETQLDTNHKNNNFRKKNTRCY